MARLHRGKLSSPRSFRYLDTIVTKTSFLDETKLFLGKTTQLLLQTTLISCFLIILILLLIEIATSLIQKPIMIEPFNTPNGLNELGYSGDIISYRFLDNVHMIIDCVNDLPNKVHSQSILIYLPYGQSQVEVNTIQISKELDFQVPNLKLSYMSFRSFLLSKISSITRISGDVTYLDKDNKQCTITIRIGDRLLHRKENIEASQIEQEIRIAAVKLLEYRNPIATAAYLYNSDNPGDKELCINFLEQYVVNFLKLRTEIQGRIDGNFELDKISAYCKNLINAPQNDVETQNILNKECEKCKLYTKENLITAYNLLGSIYFKDRGYRDALKYFSDLCDFFPEEPDLYYGLGTALYAMKEYKESLSLFKKSLSYESKNPLYIASIIKCYAALKQYDIAEAYYRSALYNSIESEHIHYAYGLMQIKLHNNAKALHCLKIALSINSTSPYTHNCIGYVYDEMGQYKLAIDYYKKTILFMPDFSTPYNNIGVTYGKIEDYNHAIEYFEKFVAMSPNLAAGYTNLGLAYSKLKKYDDAFNFYEKAIAKDPGDEIIYQNYCSTYQEYHSHQKALDQENQAIEIDANQKEKLSRRLKILEYARHLCLPLEN